MNESESQEVEVTILPLNKSKIMVQIAKKDRDVLLDLIGEHYSHSISRLAERVGMHGPNVYNALNGSKAISLAIIDKIMGAIGFQADLGTNNNLIISPRKEQLPPEPTAPTSIFADMPAGMTVKDVIPIKNEYEEMEDL